MICSCERRLAADRTAAQTFSPEISNGYNAQAMRVRGDFGAAAGLAA
jgi:hypothetical protein